MADPFAILSLVDTVFGLGCKVYEFFSAVQDAPLEIRSFANELFVLNSVLKEVKGYLKAFRTSSLSARDELHLDLVGVTLKQCNAELWDIYDAVKEKDSKQRLPLSKRLGSSSSWVLDRDERIKSTERLSRARDTLAIQTSLGRQSLIISDEVHFARDDIAIVKSSQQEILLLLSAVVAAGQGRAKSLESRADQEKTKSETRLQDISDSLKHDYNAFPVKSPESAKQADAATISQERSPTVGGYGEIIPTPSDLNPLGQGLEDPVSTSSEIPQYTQALEQALKSFQARMSPGDIAKRAPVLDSKTPGQFYSEIFQRTEDALRKSNKRGSVMRYIEGFVKHYEFMNQYMSLASSDSSALVFAAMRLMLKGTSGRQKDFSIIAEMLEEVTQVISICDREFRLYQNEATRQLAMKLYLEILDFCTRTINIFQTPTSFTLFQRSMLTQSARPELRSSVARIRRISASVRDEAEFQSRAELQQANERIVAMRVQQGKIYAAMEDQKKILTSLAEERRLVTMMEDQQSILQSLQQLQVKMTAVPQSDAEGLPSG